MHHPLPPDDTLYDQVRPILWTGYFLKLLDQRKLPFVVEYVECHSSEDVTQAIRTLIVRGAAGHWHCCRVGRRPCSA